MKPIQGFCGDTKRLHTLRLNGGNGIESAYIVSGTAAKIRIVLLRPIDEKRDGKITKENISFSWCGEKPEIVELKTGAEEVWGFLDITLAKLPEGDFELSLVDAADPEKPFKNIDRFYATVAVANPAGPLSEDCAPAACSSEPTTPVPAIDYLARDYAGFRRLMLDRLAQTIPAWRDRHPADLGITLVEALAYTADHLSYYQDAVGTEAYLGTARKRSSVRKHARLVDYRMHEGCSARAWVHVRVSDVLGIEKLKFFTEPDAPARKRRRKPIYVANDLNGGEETDRIVFEPIFSAHPDGSKRTLYPSQNALSFYLWGDTNGCLEAGSTQATIVCPKEWKDQPEQAPKVGDLILFEEIAGPQTGVAADADPNHRHVVRLTRADRDEDQIGTSPSVSILNIAWDEADALPFSLCLAYRGQEISIARGNMVLVDHGSTIEQQNEKVEGFPADTKAFLEACPTADESCNQAAADAAPRFAVVPFPKRKTKLPLTFSEPFPNRSIQADFQARQLARRKVDLARKLRTPSANPTLAKLVAQLDDWIHRSRSGIAIGKTESESLKNLEPGLTAASFLGPARDDMRPDPRNACPFVQLTEPPGLNWQMRADLLASCPEDRHCVLEIDDAEQMYFRFGDGLNGRRPQASAKLNIVYRVGNGTAGNVGAEAICRALPAGGIEAVRNPLPARGGVDPESAATAKALAPTAFRAELRRAVVADDYAQLAQMDSRVQRAAAQLAFTGVAYEAQVAIDLKAAFATADESALVLEEIAAKLNRCRRIGHSVRVRPARQFPVLLRLKICVCSKADRGRIRAEVRQLINGTSPNGYFHPDAWTFGATIFPSDIEAKVGNLTGVETVQVTELCRWNFDKPAAIIRPTEPAAPIPPLVFGPLEIPQLEENAHSQAGKLIVDLEGGR